MQRQEKEIVTDGKQNLVGARMSILVYTSIKYL